METGTFRIQENLSDKFQSRVLFWRPLCIYANNADRHETSQNTESDLGLQVAKILTLTGISSQKQIKKSKILKWAYTQSK